MSDPREKNYLVQLSFRRCFRMWRFAGPGPVESNSRELEKRLYTLLGKINSHEVECAGLPYHYWWLQ